MTHLTDDWVTLQDSIRKFVEEDPTRQDLLDEADREIEASKQLYDLRTGLGLSQEEFAEIVGLSPEEVDDMEYSDFKESPKEILEIILEKITEWQGKQNKSFRATMDSVGASADAMRYKASSGD